MVDMVYVSHTAHTNMQSRTCTCIYICINIVNITRCQSHAHVLGNPIFYHMGGGTCEHGWASTCTCTCIYIHVYNAHTHLVSSNSLLTPSSDCTSMFYTRTHTRTHTRTCTCTWLSNITCTVYTIRYSEWMCMHMYNYYTFVHVQHV